LLTVGDPNGAGAGEKFDALLAAAGTIPEFPFTCD
jgi:hypothetical protein